MDHPRPYNCISICAGVGGLDLGVEIARPGAVVVCYIEREAHAAEVLAARMADGSLSPAPIWDDLTTFDPEPWRGVVDCITSGDPCQPNSNAGKMRGRDDDRWLLDHILRIVEVVRPDRFFRENVPGNADGQLAAIVPALERMGRGVAVGLFSAEEVGFSHQRRRLFIMADLPHFGLEGIGTGDQSTGWQEPGRSAGLSGGTALADAAHPERGTGEHGTETGARARGRGRRGFASCGAAMGNADSCREGAGRVDDGEIAGIPPVERQDDGPALSRRTGGTVGHSEGDGRREGVAEPGVRGRRRRAAGGANPRMGDAPNGDVEGARQSETSRPPEHGERQHRGPSGDVEDAGRSERRPQAQEGDQRDGSDAGRGETSGRTREPGSVDVVDSDSGRSGSAVAEERSGRHALVASGGGPVADSDQSVGGPHAGKQPFGECEYEPCDFPLGAPGPSDPRWPGIIMAAPLRTPSISDFEFAKIALLGETSGVVRALDAAEAERVVRRVDARLAHRVDRLRECGNGVSSLAAALAWRTLEARLRSVD